MFNKTTINMKILLRFICVIILLSFIKKNNVPILEKLPVILKIENNINKGKINYDTIFKRVLKREKFAVINETEGMNLFQQSYQRHMSRYMDDMGFIKSNMQIEAKEAMMKVPSIGRRVAVNLFFTDTNIDSINIVSKNFTNTEKKKIFQSTFINNEHEENQTFILKMLDSCIKAKWFYTEF